MDTHERLLKPVEAADLLGISVAGLKLWRKTGIGPRFVRIGDESGPKARIRYRKTDLDEYMQSLGDGVYGRGRGNED